MTITNTLRDDDTAYCIGDDSLRLPTLKNKELDITMKYNDRASNDWEAFSNAVAVGLELKDLAGGSNLITIDVLWLDSVIESDIANMYVSETNSGVRTEHGEIMHEVTFKRGAGFTIDGVVA